MSGSDYYNVFIGKTVLKKKVKFTVTVIPVQKQRHSVTSTDQISSIFDGQTHSFTFQQTAGKYCFIQLLCYT